MSIKEFIHKIHFRLHYPINGFTTTIFSEYSTWYLYFLDFIPFLKNKPVFLYLRNGANYAIRLHTFDLIVLNEMYILKEYASLYHYITPKSVVIDIGAHIGTFSILAGRLRKGVRVFSFEPFPENFSLLQQNIQRNNLASTVFAFQTGIGARKEKRRLYIHPGNTGGHSMYKKSKKSRQITLISLKDVFKAHNILSCAFLKMDCEGAEYEILLNTPKNILNKIQCIALEYHANGNSETLVKFLEKNGFIIQRAKEQYFPLLFAVRV